MLNPVSLSGPYIYQRRYGCTLDNETNSSNKFDAFGYNGEDIITLDENKYILTKHAKDKWNEGIAEGFLERGRGDCVLWLNRFLTFGKSHVERIGNAFVIHANSAFKMFRLLCLFLFFYLFCLSGSQSLFFILCSST